MLLGLGFLVMNFLTGFYGEVEGRGAILSIEGLFATLTLFVVAGFVAMIPSLEAGWIGFGFEVLLILALLPSGWVVLALLATVFPLLIVYQMLQIKELRTFVEKHAAVN